MSTGGDYVGGRIDVTTAPPAFAAGAAARMKQTPGRGSGELCFPKTVSEAQCRELEKRVAGLTREVAQQVLDELAGRMAVEQVRNPIRYCAALVASVRRGEFQPELGVEVAARVGRGGGPGPIERQRGHRGRPGQGVITTLESGLYNINSANAGGAGRIVSGAPPVTLKSSLP